MKRSIRNICMILSILLIAGTFMGCKKYETKKYRGKYFFTAKQGFMQDFVRKDTTTCYYGSISDGPPGELIVNFSPIFNLDTAFYSYTFPGVLYLKVDSNGKPTKSSSYDWFTSVSFSDNGDVEINDGGGPNGLQFYAVIHGKRL